ncbi:uncharacterized protein LOC135197812 isoform X2 [Macrobrachium nipponense]|uniref:uncharacterized protein LOC135197812 isoform X2 n=1 Tax=Macrobrachium nipponense TaxID=159736 RepID=UPI0030C853F2
MQGGMQNEAIICRLFLRNRCSRGDACPFYHPEYNLNPESPSVAWLNFCQDFKRGQCFRQDCNFFHVNSEEEETYRLRKDIAPTLLEQAMRKALLFDVALTGTRATCKAFLQGGCSLPMCPYRHITRHEFANEVLNTLRNEFEIVLGQSGTDIPGSQQIQGRNNSQIMDPMMQGMGQGSVQGNKNITETLEEKVQRLEQENENIYRALDPEQKAKSLGEIRSRLMTLQAALQWKDENDTNKGGFVDDGLPPGMAVVNYDHSNSNFQEPSIDFMRRNVMQVQPEQRDNPDRLDKESDCKLFIGGLNSVTDTATLRNYFSRFGELVDAVVMEDKKARKSRGFGFVTYAKIFMAENAFRNGPHTIDGKVVDTKFAKPRSDDGRGSSPKRGSSPRRSNRDRSPDRGENRIPKIFVGGLSEGITTEVLRNYFQPYGSIVDCISMVDLKTRRHRGFGFVEFKDWESTNMVLADVPHRILGCLVTVDRPMPRDKKDPQSSRSGGSGGGGGGGGGGSGGMGGIGGGGGGGGGGNGSGSSGDDSSKMFVGGLSFSTNERALREHFSRFGKVKEAKINRDGKGASKGFGFVVFSDSYMVEDAMDSGPHEIDGRRVDTGYASKRNEKKSGGDSGRNRRDRRRSPDRSGDKPKVSREDACKLYIGQITNSINEDDLERYFSSFGDIRKVEIKSAPKSKSGYGFVTYEEPEMVDSAIEAAPHEINGCSIEVGRAVSKGDRNDRNSRDEARRGNRKSKNDKDQDSSATGSGEQCTMFVGNLSEEANEETLYDYFCKYGEIKEARITTDSKGTSRGYGFIRFAEGGSVQEAIDDGPHEIDGCVLKVGSAHSKGQDKRNIELKNLHRAARTAFTRCRRHRTEESLIEYKKCRSQFRRALKEAKELNGDIKPLFLP